MKFERLQNNLISVIKEAQIKLGYDGLPIGMNYHEKTLCHLLGEKDATALYPLLLRFAEDAKDVFGEIGVVKNENGYRLDVASKGAAYVHGLLREEEFLSVFIRTVRKPLCTVDDVVAVFRSFSDAVHVERVTNGEFDWLLYFENGDVDDFWYCLHEDDLMLEYHRFIKEDYLDFEF